LEELGQRVNADERLVWRGRFVDTTFLVEVGESVHLVKVSGGRITSVTPGPLVMPSWTFALRTSKDAWQKFCLPEPPPGFHDLLALVKHRRLRIEGDLHPFMANLLYFKGVMAKLRPQRPIK
jgi:hypothetical protein